MANVLTSVRTHTSESLTGLVRRPLTRQHATATETPKATAKSTATTSPESAQPAATPAPAAQVSEFHAVFSRQVFPVEPEVPAQKPNPTAESVFGPNPWMTNPTGIGPDGQSYSYNPFYFATQSTASKVAEMIGGTVVETKAFTPNGGVFSQQQSNYMVRLNDGRMINPGLVASFYSHGYSQSYVDQMVAAEVNNA